MISTPKNNRGFTLIELILVIGVLSVVFGSSTIVFGNVIQRNSLKYNGYQLVQNLREARINSVSQKNDSAWGIYFDDTSIPHGYTFFKGQSYNTRDSNLDLVFEFPEVVTINQLSLGGFDEVVFSQSSGLASNSGSIDLLADTETYSISINDLGFVNYQF